MTGGDQYTEERLTDKEWHLNYDCCVRNVAEDNGKRQKLLALEGISLSSLKTHDPNSLPPNNGTEAESMSMCGGRQPHSWSCSSHNPPQMSHCRSSWRPTGRDAERNGSERDGTARSWERSEADHGQWSRRVNEPRPIPA